MGGINLNVLPFCKLFAKGTHSQYQSQNFEARGMQAMRQRMEINSNFAYSTPKLVDAPGGFDRRVGNKGCSSFKINRQNYQPLAKVVMQFPREAAALLLLRSDEPSAEFEALLVGGVVPRYPSQSSYNRRPPQLQESDESDFMGHDEVPLTSG